MARKTLFDILGDRARGARVLDLFAGAGTLGIEALSRGAREAMFVERDRAACSIILQNLELSGYRGVAQVRRGDVARIVSKPPETPFDLVFLDPPYDAGLPFVGLVLGSLGATGWVVPGGTVVVEAAAGHVEWPSGFREIRTRRFGRTQLSVAEREDGRASSDISGDV